MLNPLNIESVRTCTLCPLLGKDHCPSEGNPQADVMIVGQSPGATEAQLGRPFVGPAGDLLDFMLDQAELDRDQVYIANVLKCRPPGNRASQPGERAACYRTWLHDELKQVDPRLVVCVGKEAHTVLLPSHIKFSHEHKTINRRQNRMYLSVYHPAYFLRQGRVSEFLKAGDTVRECLEEIESWERPTT